MKNSIITRGVALGVGLVLMPAAAFAVNVSANDGNGEQHRTRSYSNGADVSGNLRSTSGKPVYYSGRVALSNCSDPSTGRYASNTTSTSYVTRGGTISYWPKSSWASLPPDSTPSISANNCDNPRPRRNAFDWRVTFTTVSCSRLQAWDSDWRRFAV